MLNIASFTFQFDAAEDRIRLIGNLNNEQPRVDLWLTRRLTLRLLDAGNQMVQHTSERVSHSPAEFRGAMAQFEHEAAQEKMQTAQERIPDHDESGQLLHRIDISHRDGRYQLKFFASQDQLLAASVLNYPELHQVLHLIHQGSEVLEWGAPKHLFADAIRPERLQ